MVPKVAPLRRNVTPADIGDVAVYLASGAIVRDYRGRPFRRCGLSRDGNVSARIRRLIRPAPGHATRSCRHRRCRSRTTVQFHIETLGFTEYFREIRSTIKGSRVAGLSAGESYVELRSCAKRWIHPFRASSAKRKRNCTTWRFASLICGPPSTNVASQGIAAMDECRAAARESARRVSASEVDKWRIDRTVSAGLTRVKGLLTPL